MSEQGIELKVKVRLDTISRLDEVMKKIKDIEKEYSCNCTLLEIEVNTQK